MLSSLLLINVTPGARRAPPADIYCPPAAQRHQAKRALLIRTENTKCVIIPRKICQSLFSAIFGVCGIVGLCRIVGHREFVGLSWIVMVSWIIDFMGLFGLFAIVRTISLRLLALCGWWTYEPRPGLILINYKVENISKYVCLTVIIDIIKKITKFSN